MVLDCHFTVTIPLAILEVSATSGGPNQPEVSFEVGSLKKSTSSPTCRFSFWPAMVVLVFMVLPSLALAEPSIMA